MGRRRRRQSKNIGSLSYRGPLSYRRPLRLEPLEDRRMMAVITVTTNSDVIDFNDGVVSLREAVFVANTAPGVDSIEFDFGHDGPATIVLTQGELVITDSVTIMGAGAGLLTIDASGNDPTPDENNGDGSRVFLIDDGVKDNRFTVELRGLTITGGDSDELRGGGIHSHEHLTVRESVISGNAIRNAIDGEGIAGWGGGIQSLYGNLTIIDSKLTGNSATVAGGAIDFNRVNFDASLLIVNSTIEENAGGARGGGVLIAGNATITDTVIHDNEAGEGGGIAIWSNASQATISIENSQITNNRAGAGGGIYSTSNAATFLIVGSAISGNEAVSVGGGILMRRSGPLAATAYSLEIRESTISGNLAAGGVGIFATDPTDGAGIAVKIEWSRIAENMFHLPSTGPAGGIATPRIARLVIADSVVESNDGMGIQARGVGQPHGVLKLERSHVRDNGHSGVYVRDLSSTLTDSTVTGNGDDGVSNHSGSLNVLGGSFNDNLGTGIYSHTGDVNIVGATISGNTTPQPGGGIYSFQGKLTVATSIVSGNQSASGGGGIHHGSNGSHTLRITDSMISDNAGRRGGGVYSSQYVYVADSIISKNQATFQGGGIDALNRVVLLRSAVTDNLTTGPNRSGGGISAVGAADLVLIQDSSVSNNSATGSGGGIQTIATVRVTRSSVLGNAAFSHGGGIHAPGRTITVTDSTVARNRTTGPNAQGGGIVGGVVTMTQSTVSGNRTEGSGSPGGGIVASQLTLNQSMVVDNHALAADAMSGGIQVSGATNLSGSIIADNSAGGGNPDVRTGSFVAPNYSLVGNTTGLTAVQLNVLNAGVGNLLNSDPKLGPLAYNGGPTFADGSRMLTHALLAGSSAIDAGNPLASGPLAMYRFEESVGALLAADAVGANDGAYHGDPNLGSDGSPFVGGDGVNLDGIDDYVTTPATVTDDFTFSLWVNTAQPALSGVRIGLVDADAVNAVSGFGLYIEGGRFVFRTAGLAINWSMPINNGNWHHLAVTRNTSTGARNLYVDGVLRGSAASGPTGALADVTEWSIGQILAGTGRFAGRIDELAVYDRVLSAAEIERQAAAGVPIFDQRGEPHLRVLDGDGAGGARIDIGAYEHQFGETYNFVVDTLVDESDGDYSAGDFSLREAIELANANLGKDSIEFDPALWVNGPQTIALSLVGNQSNDRSALFISDSLALHGPGADLLTLDASALDPTPELNNGDGGRVIEVTDHANTDSMEVEISGLTIRGGDVGSDGSAFVDGGGIRVQRVQFALSDCIVVDNSTQASGGGVAIYVEQSQGSSIIDGCTFEGNYAGGAGGGLLTNTSNFAPTIVRDSLFLDNVAALYGGGVVASSNFFLNIPFILENSTLSGNTAMQGGGLYLHSADGAIIRNSTITNNTASTATGTGGIFAYSDEAILQNAIVAGNHASDSSSSDLGRRIDAVFGNDGSFAVSHSLIGSNVNSGLDEAPVGSPDANGNLIGGAAHGVINPLLGPLVANGGPTRTYALLPGSLAIDAGDAAAVAGMGGVPEFDQRGLPWSRVVGGRIDMGAVESQSNPLPGDYNFNGKVDAADYSVWRDTRGSVNDLRADGTSAAAPGVPDGIVDALDYAFWKANFGNKLVVGIGAGGGSAGIAAGELRLAGEVASGAIEIEDTAAATANDSSAAFAPVPARRSSPAIRRGASFHGIAALRDDALLAWLARHPAADADDSSDGDDATGADGTSDADDSIFDEVFAGMSPTL